MSADTLVQLEQVRSGRYNDWHAALLLVLWRPFWLLGFGAGWVTWVSIVVFVLGLYGLLRMRFRPPGAAGAAVAIALSPPVVGYVVYLGRDMWFTALFLVAGAVLALAVRASGRVRLGLVAGFAAAVWLMQAARQNAILSCAVLIFAALWILSSRVDTMRAERRRFRAILVGTGATLLLSVVLLGSQAALRSAFDVESAHPEQALFVYDVAAISNEKQEVLFDPMIYPAQSIAELNARFDPSFMHAYVFGPQAVIAFPIPDSQIDVLRDDWVDAIKSNPLSYLEERLTLWLEQISVTEASSWIAHPGIDSNQWGYTARFPELDAALQDYVRFFAANDQLDGGVVHTVWPYLLVLLVGTWHLRSVRPAYRCLGWIAVSCLVYQISLFFGLMGTGYRLNLHCIVISLTIAVVSAADGLARWRGRRDLARELADRLRLPASTSTSVTMET